MEVGFRDHMLGKKRIGLFQECLWSEAGGKFLQVGKGFASFPVMLAVMEAGVLAVITAADPLLQHPLIQMFGDIPLAKGRQKGDAISWFHGIGGAERLGLAGPLAQRAGFGAGRDVWMVDQRAGLVDQVAEQADIGTVFRIEKIVFPDYPKPGFHGLVAQRSDSPVAHVIASLPAYACFCQEFLKPG